MTRWKASAIHLSISTTVALITLTLMLSLWFAPPFFSSAGGREVLLIMLGVDITLGPFITLIIFNTKKSRRALVFDFVVIGLLQLSALAYGVNTMFHGRPVFVVFIKNSYDMVLANQLAAADLRQAPPQFRSLPITGPVYVYSKMPTNIKEQNDVVLSAFSGKDLPFLPKYYQPYSGHEPEVGASAQPISTLRKLNPNRVGEIDSTIRDNHWDENDIGFLPLRSKFEDVTVVVNRQSGKILKILKMRPWVE